jgi:hypothetical protein
VVNGLNMAATIPVPRLRWRHRSLSPLPIPIINFPRRIPQVRPVHRIPRRKPISIRHRMYHRLRNLHPFTARAVSHVVATKISPSFATSARTARVCQRFVIAVLGLALMGLWMHRWICSMVMGLLSSGLLAGLLILTIELGPLGIPLTLYSSLLAMVGLALMRLWRDWRSHRMVTNLLSSRTP